MSELHRCATCPWRRVAEQKPRSIRARLWRWHTRFCPGWKAYQRSLADARAATPDAGDA